MVWYMLVADPMINTIIWCAVVFILGMMGICAYFVQDWLRSDTVIIVNRDGTLDIKTRIIKREERIRGYIERGKYTYSLEQSGVHTTRSFPQWKKIYIWDEGVSMPRRIMYRKDDWFAPDTMTKIVNDTRIKQMTKEAIDPALKMFIILGALGGCMAAVASVIMLLMQLGIIKGG